LKRTIVSKAKEIIVMVDGSKFHQSGLASYASVDQISTIVTDNSVPGEELKRFEQRGIKVLRAH